MQSINTVYMAIFAPVTPPHPPFYCYKRFRPVLNSATPGTNGIRPVFMSLNSPADIDG